MDDADPPKDQVGYKRPPIETRWKKGQSGNPSGKRKKDASFAKAVMDALSEKVTLVGKDGKRRKCTKFELSIIQLVNKAAAGDLRATKEVTALYREVQPQAAPEPLRIIIEGGLPDVDDQEKYFKPADGPEDTN
jgi:Family of unknown function (DUF5681)